MVTEDGYVSQLYRIPGKAGDLDAQKPAVLMMHGIECDMNFWIPNYPENVPPFILADQGYDVWLGNNRGSRYSEFHISLDPSQLEYWKFDPEELGLKDVTAFIDYILAKTGQEKLTYIGHSQGTTQMFMASALNPRYFEKKVNLFVALGPATKMNNVQVPAFRAMSTEWQEVEYLAVKEGAYNLLDAGWLEEDAA